MVCDSIHQLSHGAPTRQPNIKIAQHLGIDERSVRRAKETLLEKGLIAEIDGGVTSTEKWNFFVTFRQNADPIRQNAESNRQNAESYYIDKDNINTETKVSDKKTIILDEKKLEPSPKPNYKVLEITVVPANEHGDPIDVSPRKPRQTWDAEKAVFQTFSEKCKREVGVAPEPAALWQLKRIRIVLQTYNPTQLKDLFEDWFATASDDQILNIHAALSAHNLNKFKMQK
jgi:hypothetical protein